MATFGALSQRLDDKRKIDRPHNRLIDNVEVDLRRVALEMREIRSKR